MLEANNGKAPAGKRTKDRGSQRRRETGRTKEEDGWNTTKTKPQERTFGRTTTLGSANGSKKESRKESRTKRRR